MYAYQLFLSYVEMGNARKLDLVAQASGRRPDLIANLSVRFKWVSRAKAYDQYLVEVQLRAVEKSVKDQAVIWAKRHAEHHNQEYETAEALLKKAKEMLAVPLFETIETDIQEVNGALVPLSITRKPARWTLNTIPLFVDTAAKLFRLSLEMDTSRERLTIDIKSDPEARLAMAKASVIKLTEKLDSMVDLMIDADPTVDRGQATEQLKQHLHVWVSEDWDVDPELLKPEDETASLTASGGTHVN